MGEFSSAIYPRVKLISYIRRMKVKETNPINDILIYIPHFEEVDQIRSEHNKPSSLVGGQKGLTNCNLDTSYIMK